MFRGFGGRHVRRIARGRASSAQLDSVNVLNTGELVTVVVVDVAWDDVGVIDPGSFCFATSLVTTTGNCVFTISYDLDDVCAPDWSMTNWEAVDDFWSRPTPNESCSVADPYGIVTYKSEFTGSGSTFPFGIITSKCEFSGCCSAVS